MCNACQNFGPEHVHAFVGLSVMAVLGDVHSYIFTHHLATLHRGPCWTISTKVQFCQTAWKTDLCAVHTHPHQVALGCVKQRKLQMPGTANEHKRQETPTINPIDHQPTQLTDQAPSTIERAARESKRITQSSTAAVHAFSTATTCLHSVPQRTADGRVGAPQLPSICRRHTRRLSLDLQGQCCPRRGLVYVLMRNCVAVSSAGTGRAVSHTDVNEPAQPRKRARCAGSTDRACGENIFAAASSFAMRAADRASASA